VNHHAGHLVDGSRGFCLWASHREPGICTHTREKKKKSGNFSAHAERKWIGFPADLVSVTAATGGSGEGERSTESVIYFASYLYLLNPFISVFSSTYCTLASRNKPVASCHVTYTHTQLDPLSFHPLGYFWCCA
jgi:hypothetical protein